MRVLAIDPGPGQSAFVLWDGERVLSHGIVPNADLCAYLHGSLRVYPFGPLPQLVVEMIASYGMPVGREVFETCMWIGRFVEAYETFLPGWKAQFMYRLAVKSHLCHDSKAKDANIRQALIDRLGAPGTKKAPGMTYGIHGDEWAALAVAVTAWDGLQGKAASEAAGDAA